MADKRRECLHNMADSIIGTDTAGMNSLQRFLAVMECQPCDRVPNWELGTWPQTQQRWIEEGLTAGSISWDWFTGEPKLGMDHREFIAFTGSLVPPFEPEVLEEDERTEVVRDASGRIRRALKEGAIGQGRASMDQYLRFVVENRDDWREVSKRFDPTHPGRLEPGWQQQLPRWREREVPLVFGPNMQTMGFYWMAREMMGTENLSFAWYDQPELMHEMMDFWGNFLIEAARPVIEKTDLEYINLSEDMAMKNGPLLGPETYRTFIFPHMRRVVEFYKSHGVRHVFVDTDGNPEMLIPLLMNAGVDLIWPLERTADQDPIRLRKKFGRSLRLSGGVDKRVLALGPEAIDAHLRQLLPLVAEGGYIPTVDHTVPPDVSWDSFRYYMDAKQKLLEGTL